MSELPNAALPAENLALREQLENVIDEQRDAYLNSGWWHSIDLGEGRITPGVHQLSELRANYERFALPNDFAGKRVLDIGCWDGFYTFEAERHGARVTAVDVWRPNTWFIAKAALNSPAEFHEHSVYELSRDRLGAFDYVLFLGVLYHLKHPLLALERVCELTHDCAVIETHAVDNLFSTARPVMEFYEIDQLGGQYDNWWGPNSTCVTQMLRAAGFVRTEPLAIDPTRAVIKAYRTWLPKPVEAEPSLKVRRILNACTDDVRFPRRGKHAYLALMIEGLPDQVERDQIEIEVGPYGCYAVYVGASKFAEDAGCVQVSAPIPPGLPVGLTTVTFRYGQQRAAASTIQLIEGSEW